MKKVGWESKFTDLFDPFNNGLKRLISVYAESILSCKTILNRLEGDARVDRLFDTDLSHVQRYLFTRLKIEPTNEVEVEYDRDNSRLIRTNKINEDVPQPPPFSIMYFEVQFSFSPYSGPLDRGPITEIKARYQEEPAVSFEGDEDSILKGFQQYVLSKDPDIVIYKNGRFGGIANDYLFERIGALGLDLGRDSSHHKSTDRINRINGRVYLSNKSFHNNLDLAGLIERARFGFLPLSMAARYGMNRVIDSRNCYTLIQRGFVIPGRENGRYEPIRALEEINSKDKGGMIFSPRVGLHENVVVLDYENEYANLILRHNLSYETIPSKSGGISSQKQGLLPNVVEGVLKRRIYFKNLKESYPVNTNEWHWCEHRIDSLKSILVSLYGTSGSLWNRFANVLTYEEINRVSREVLMKTKDIVQTLGFELLYADTDSVFLKKDRAPIEEYENIRDVLAKETGLPISIEHHYKFLVLLPLEASERMEALKHYFGITQSGELIARGIEIRRHDTPNFIKQFQTELLYTLFNCENSEEVFSKGYENALLLLTKTIDKLMTGDIHFQDLVVSKLLGQGLDKYKSLFPHVSAAIQLANKGKSTMVGDGIEYIFTNSRHSNPLRRVTATEFIKQGQEFDYDKEKYREMLLEAAGTVLGYFGFDRTIYGNSLKRKNRKWWAGLNEERARDRDNESDSGI